MKRALAERAKAHDGGVGHHTEHHHGGPSPSTSTSTPTPSPSSPRLVKGPPPRKLQRISTLEEGEPSSSSASGGRNSMTPRSEEGRGGRRKSGGTPRKDTPKSSSSHSKNKKRQRNHHSSSNHHNHSSSSSSSNDEEEQDEEEEGDEQRSSFYLRHQNRALASELKSYKRRLDLLEREREMRRRSCQEAREKIGELEVVWGEMEGVVCDGLRGLGQEPKVKDENNIKSENGETPHTTFLGPASTGSGSNVESVSSLLESLTRMSQSSSSSKLPNIPNPASSTHICQRPEDDQDNQDTQCSNNAVKDEEQEEQETQFNMTSRTASSVSDRATRFRKSLLSFLSVLVSTHGKKNNSRQQTPEMDVLDVAMLHGKISALESKCGDFESKVGELSKARDEANASEHRVRRGLYRLASGRMKIGEVLKAVEKEDGFSLMGEFAKMEQISTNSALVGSSSVPSNVLSSSALDASTSIPTTGSDGDVTASDGGQVNSGELALLNKKLQDLEELSQSRGTKIKELLEEREKRIKQTNSLLLPGTDKSKVTTSDDDIKNSSIYTDTAAKLVSAERKIGELERELEAVKEQWGVAKGDVELARKTVEDLDKKHAKRWKELGISLTQSSQGEPAKPLSSQSTCNGAKDGGSNSPTSESLESKAALTIISLEHKLRQALETVRQSETIRISLTETNKMNDCLQSKLDEFKAKNAALVAGKSAARASAESSERSERSERSSSSHSSSERSREHSSHRSSSSHSSERLHRDHRRMRKELAAAIASKESAKNKQERAEKERDSLLKTNARILKQSAEKDEMNAKSLSTVLQLKHLTEELNKEKELLHKKVKGAEQLALAARLAAKAKEKVQEETLNEIQAAQKGLDDAKKNLEQCNTQKDHINVRLSQSKAQIVSIVKDLNAAKQRCNELASEITAKDQEKSQLTEELAISKRETIEARKKAALAATATTSTARSQSGASSEFSVEQLTTQATVLKGRLACPVCNDRDKQVILLRCRHMFCRPCVDKNIKNRSRKCPACATRFDMKEVGDVWL